jgi:hypothetical protein
MDEFDYDRFANSLFQAMESRGFSNQLATNANNASESMDNVNTAATGTAAIFGKVVNTLTTGIKVVGTAIEETRGNTQGSVLRAGNVFGDDLTSQVAQLANIAEDSFYRSQALANQGTILNTIQQFDQLAANLQINKDQLVQLGSQVELLRASGGLPDDVLENFEQVKDAFGQETLENFKALGIELDTLTFTLAAQSALLGPVFLANEENRKTLDSVIEENIKNQKLLAQTTGMSVEAQQRAVESMVNTPALLARQLDLITNPRQTQNLIRFSNTLAAIGASDLAEGFLSGVGLPTPGNEIEAALKPMTTALLGQMSAMIASGASAEEIRAMEDRIAQVYAQESAGVMQQLGRFAPYLGSEFGFLRRDVERQRATILGTAQNPMFVSMQRTDAQQNINRRIQGVDQTMDALIDNQVLLAEASKEVNLGIAELLDPNDGILVNGLRGLIPLSQVMLGTAQQVKEMLRSAENEPGSIQSDATAMSRILDRLQSQQGLTPEQRSLLEEFSALESTIDTLAAGGQVSNEEALDFNTLRAAERDLINDERAKMLDEQPGGNVLAGQQVSPNIVQEAILDLVDKISELIPILRIGNQNQALMAEKLNTSLMQNAAANDRVNTTAQQTGGIVAFNPGAR